MHKTQNCESMQSYDLQAGSLLPPSGSLLKTKLYNQLFPHTLHLLPIVLHFIIKLPPLLLTTSNYQHHIQNPPTHPSFFIYSFSYIMGAYIGKGSFWIFWIILSF